MPTKSRAAKQADQANFVFQGTVKKLKATTMSEIQVSDRTIVVHVDRLIYAPESLSDYTGQDITVQLATGEKVKAAQTLIFRTNGWIFGDGLAVQSVGHEKATASAVAAMSSHPDDPVRSLNTRAAMSQATTADLIVSGRVVSVRLPEAEVRARATAGTSGQTTERVSEHAPLWQEAIIHIDEVHKGKHSQKQVVVRFPSSTDVRWYHAPKFHAGQEGVFLLHKEQLADAPRAMAAAVLGSDEYTALHASDFQPLEELPRIIMAAKAEGS